MKSSLAKEVNRIIVLIALSLVAALAIQNIWPLVVGLLGYIVWSTRQLFALYTWLIREEHTEPPDSVGLWGEFYTRLEHLFQQERRAQENLQGIILRAQQSVNALEDAVVLIDSHGYLEYWNHAAHRLMGLNEEKDLGQPLTNLIRHPRFTEYLSRGDFREPLEIPGPVDDNRILQFRITEFGVGDQLILARDVTRLHHLEEMRKDFVANVSHELKTPLTVLKGYLETLQDTVPEEQARLRRALSQMASQSQRMEALVHDLLLLSRLESTNTDNTHQAVTVHGMLKRMRESALALAPDKHHEIVLEVPETARLVANPAELESAFGNLITNAVKYTPEGGHILIRWWQDDKGAHFSVSDDGIGIDPKHIPRLTERFYRPDTSRVTQTGGTGLGLAIVKHVLIRHGARLEIRSELGKGSVFTCHFPRERLVSKPTALAQ
ncbi:phosphate regulon sensor histidine kinase PhoR [Alloalcanivorax xenomutans]|jgi:two-component system, OmpR family, phosphate regulon sensor histidine kinase PhoR|uniref:Phosphate regulon sensor protein PhoR n=1 Tax=Alloalcanivorax xenomutans TaxID=1094342 RepID=A0A9Q3VYP7_9GAMM|nr:phosphate regulon sensor histidine kinase PhoR [Alloalcanivorax xenomutans]ARB47615.1 histidine kinase [Alloalcanivorax xenomutans]ERS09360.1 histidine kinase [Alcanivorax sp. PN-3]KYZ85661.1 PAS domain-containing sensor histidine kinase [Alcanivorax sp. KX64203]MCE7507515.1 phosphate regulon sensor histidine kinase PhoR [Alloalcanivorax xenomutans]